MGWAAAAPYLIGAGGSILGGLLGRKKDQQQSTNFNQTSTSTPTFGQFSPLISPLVQLGMNRLRNKGGLPAGYAEQGIQGINSAYDLVQAGAQNRLASSGQQIAGAASPAAVLAQGNLAGSRGAEIGQFLTNLPNVARDFENQDIAQVMAMLGLGRGQTTTSSGQGTGNYGGGESVGQGIGAGLTDLGSILGFLYGNRQASTQRGTPNPYGGNSLGGGLG